MRINTNMLKRTLYLFLALALLAPLLVSCAAEVTPAGVLRLAMGGNSDYRVVISKDASEDMQKIAREFTDYFEKITSVTLPIVSDEVAAQEKEIVLGKTTRKIDANINYDNLTEEELVYFSNRSSLLLTGVTERAVAYAVYGFLEDYCGVRYWSADYEKVPSSPTLDIPTGIAYTDEPTFWYRSMNEAGSADEKWMVKMRLNSRQSLGSERFRLNPYVGGGHGYADWFVHTIGKLAEMPYGPNGTHLNQQPCLSSEETYQTVLKNVRAWLEQYPDANLISISQNDGGDVSAMCICDNCRKLYADYGETQSAKWVWFVCKVANELKDEYPDVYFDTLAYNFTINAPSGLEIPDNVIIRLAPAHTCLNHDYKSCHTHGNFSQPQDTTINFSYAMQEWAEIAPHRFIWDYGALFYNYLAPFCNFDYVHKNIRNFADDGVEGVFIQGNSSGSNGFAELRAYLVAKCLWDPYMTDEEYEALMKEFIEGYYGTGTSEPLMEYIAFINERLEGKHFTLYAYMVTDWFIPFAYTTDEEGVTRLDYSDMIDPMYAYFDRANALVTDEAQLHHLRKARTQVKYYEAMASFWIIYRGDKVEIDYERRNAVNRSLYDDIIACGIQELSEGQKITQTPNFNNSPLYWDR